MPLESPWNWLNGPITARYIEHNLQNKLFAGPVPGVAGKNLVLFTASLAL